MKLVKSKNVCSLQGLPKTSYYKLIDWWLIVSLNILVLTMLFHTYISRFCSIVVVAVEQHQGAAAVARDGLGGEERVIKETNIFCTRLVNFFLKIPFSTHTHTAPRDLGNGDQRDFRCWNHATSQTSRQHEEEGCCCGSLLEECRRRQQGGQDLLRPDLCYLQRHLLDRGDARVSQRCGTLLGRRNKLKKNIKCYKSYYNACLLYTSDAADE